MCLPSKFLKVNWIGIVRFYKQYMATFLCHIKFIYNSPLIGNGYYQVLATLELHKRPRLCFSFGE